MPLSKRRFALSLGFQVFFRMRAKTINRLECRRADSDVNIWTVPLLNRLGIALTRVFHVGIEKGLHFALQRPVLKHRVIPTPRPTVPGFRFTELLFFSSGSGVSDTLEKGEMRVDYAPA
jgi:hypothetical protein